MFLTCVDYNGEKKINQRYNAAISIRFCLILAGGLLYFFAPAEVERVDTYQKSPSIGVILVFHSCLCWQPL